MVTKVNTSVYDAKFFAKYGDRPGWKKTAASIAKAVIKTTRTKEVIDLGCGAGITLMHLQDDYGVEVRGIEGSPASKPFWPASVKNKIRIGNLPRALRPKKSHTVLCLEVAEHIPTKSSRTLVRNCVRACSTYLVFSAAPPGQGGKSHINCQEWSFWEKLFKAEGYTVHKNKTKRIKELLKAYGAAEWYCTNTRVLHKS